MKKFAFVILIALIGIVVNWLALLAGWWWVTSVVGLLIGLFLRPASVSLLLALCVGGLGWGLPLAVLATYAPVMKIAATVESVIGLSSTGGTLIVVLTIVLGCLLSIPGSWVGITIRHLLPGQGQQTFEQPAQARR